MPQAKTKPNGSGPGAYEFSDDAQRFVDDAVDLLAVALKAPMVTLSVLENARKWIRAAVGAEVCDIDSRGSFCARALASGRRLVVEDTHSSRELACSPFVTGPPYVRAYLGVPLTLNEDQPSGVLAVVDTVPRQWDAVTIESVERVARMISRFAATGEMAATSQAEAELQRTLANTEAMHRTLISKMQEGVIVQNREGTIIASNPAASMILGLTEDQLAGRSSMDPRWRIIKQDGTPLSGNQHPSMVALETGRAVTNFVLGVDRPNAEQRWVRVNATPLFDDGYEQATRAVVTFSDITDQRQHEEKLIAAREQAEQAAVAKQRFLANVSHEIRTPLNGIIGIAQVLQNSDLTTEQEEWAKTIIGSGRTLTMLLNDILDLSKMDSGKFTVVPTPENLREAMKEVENLWRPSANDSGLDFSMDIDPAVPDMLRFDRVRVNQCISNLVSNAIKFTPKGYVGIHVDARPVADGEMLVTIRVRDTGIGMDGQTMGRLFQPFEQADDSTSRKYGGTGLGLSVVRRLAENMGGSASVDSKLGIGSEFRFSFRAPVETSLAAALEGPEDFRSAASLGLSGCRVLIVDDLPMNRMVCHMFLKQHGVETLQANNGKEALDILYEQDVDLVLLDLHMPVMDGCKTIGAIRRSETPWAGMPVIALTADAMTGMREKCTAMGMDGFLSKPLSERDLVTEMLRVLRHPRSEDAANEAGLPRQRAAAS